MKRLCSFIGLLAQIALLAGLLWKHAGLYDLQAPFLLLFISPLLAVAHWKLLTNERVARTRRIELFFLTAPAAILSLSLILALTLQIKALAMLGGPSKEMIPAMKQIPIDYVDQWTEDYFARMQSERQLYAMIFASTCVLYGSRLSAAEREPVTTLKGNE